ncbi:cell division protein FtsI (penicillin-binding protein 3) [Diaminobutyricimonas aerilata]|uniref:Cell division protein FtsI (Penicillin-binding protein 3) n=1 Tax=Diaminobutyricimonas aerilata TaxID=1162967 RepID=A0A2M9CKH4_9MICO|nr:penicillin-binding protein 2 [Diaminobutyricimonas aerilata]PJJ72392.1 cell division protein FtsI (penicillin-binding protein 3) [Diaminobutyricimonas aerilata]
MKARRSTRARLSIAMLIVFAVFAVFVVRLVDIQMVQANDLNAESQGKRSVPDRTYGTRGAIVDANGTELAYTVTRYNITVSPKVMLGTHGVDDDLMTNLSDIAALTGQDVNELVTALTADPESNFAYLTKKIDTATFRAVRDLDIAGIYFEPVSERIYPQGSIAGNLVGNIGTDGPQAGIEMTEDACLASADGSAVYEKSEDGVRLPGSTVVTDEAKDGGTVRLTIDSDLQWFVQQALAEQAIATGSDWATAVVVRVEDGHIMAAADYPAMDPNDVNNAPKDADGGLITGSRLFAIPYEPGSTFKAMSMAMLVDQGLISPTTRITAPGWFTTPTGERLTDAWAHGDIHYTMAGALANSSNTGISTLVQQSGMSAQQRYEYMRKFGVGEKTAVQFNGESAGLFREPQDWDGLSNFNIMFGQGVAATSAQVAAIYQTLGNDGTRMPLTLVEGCELPDGTITDLPDSTPIPVVSGSAADQIVSVLEKTVTDTPIGKLIKVPGYRVAAKTGTAEVARSDGSGYGSDRIVSVAGLAPAEDPKYAVVVTLGLPDTIKTSSAAAPTFGKIMSKTLTTFRVPPSTQPAPAIPLTW